MTTEYAKKIINQYEIRSDSSELIGYFFEKLKNINTSPDFFTSLYEDIKLQIFSCTTTKLHGIILLLNQILVHKLPEFDNYYVEV